MSNYFEKKNLIEDLRYTVNPNIYINNSILSAINPDQGGSPKKFVKEVNDNKEENNSKSLSLGRLIHKYIESPEDFIVADFDMPNSEKKLAYLNSLKFEGIKTEEEVSEAMMIRIGSQSGYKIERNKADTAWNGLSYLKFDENDKKYLDYLWNSKGKLAVTAKENEQLSRMKNSLNNHKKVSEALFSSIINIGSFQYIENEDFRRYKELAIYWQETMGDRIINKKALIDNMLVFPKLNSIIKYDLKSSSNSIYSFSSDDLYKGTFESWRMYRQIAHYDEAIENLYMNPTAYAITVDGRELRPYGKTLPTIQNNIIPIETFGDYLTAIIPVTEDWILHGKREVKSLVERIVWHMDKNEWNRSKEEVEAGGVLPIKRLSEIPRLKFKKNEQISFNR